MRHLLAAFAAVLMLSASAQAATLPATPLTAPTVIRAAQPGDTVQVRGGELVSIPLKYRPDNLTIDLTGVTITGNSGTGLFNGLTIIGGRYTGTIPFTFTGGGKALVLRDMEMVAPAIGAGSAITLQNIDGATVANITATGYRNGVIAQQVSNVDVGGMVLDRTQRDCFSVAAVWTVYIHNNSCKGNLPLDGDHPDCAQIRSIIGLKPTSDVIVQDNVCEGQIQGPTTTAHGDDPGFDRLTYRRNHVISGFPTGLGAGRVRGLVLEGNDVATLPGSPYPSRIVVDPVSNTDVVWIGTNTQAAYGFNAAYSYPPTIVVPPPPPPTPEQLEIAALKAKVAALTADLAAAGAARDAAQAQLVALNDTLAGVTADRARLTAQLQAANDNLAVANQATAGAQAATEALRQRIAAAIAQ